MREETYGKILKCPYCGYLKAKCGELGCTGYDYGETKCFHCGEEFYWERIVSVSYRGKPRQEKGK